MTSKDTYGVSIKRGDDVYADIFFFDDCHARHAAGDNTNAETFVGMEGQFYLCQDKETLKILLYKFAIKAENITPATWPYTITLFPRGVVYVREKGNIFHEFMVIRVGAEGVGLSTDENPSFKTLEADYEISTDLCETWGACCAR